VNTEIKPTPYNLPDYYKKDGELFMKSGDSVYPLQVFGEHNLQNIAGAMEICGALGITEAKFSEAISSFKGASKRLQLIDKDENTAVYLDFAHAPSKLKATVTAVKGHFNDKNVVACMELHTYSSLNQDFLAEYKGAMDKADKAFVYFNPHTLELKKLPPISTEQVKEAFGRDDLMVFNDSSQMLDTLLQEDWNNSVLLLMSSGNFDGLEPEKLAGMILNKKG